MFRQLPSENTKPMSTRCAYKIGEGTYGVVFKCAKDSRYVVKCEKLTDTKEGVSYPSLREWVICSNNRHYNIPKAIHIDMESNKVVYPHYGKNIGDIRNLTRNEKISITQQVARGISYAHCSLGVINRDIKTDNIMYNRETGRCVVIDWGIGRREAVDATMTGQMYTLWYRPPEILLGSRQYDFSADIWAMGIVLLELWLDKNIKGNCNIDQLFGYFRLWGTPTPTEWPSMTQYNGWRSSFPQWKETWSTGEDVRTLRKKEPWVIHLIEHCLQYDPNKRITSCDLIRHPILRNQLSTNIFVFPSLQQRAANLPPLGNIMANQADLNWNMRTILYDWLNDIRRCRKFRYHTLFIAIQTCDRVLAKAMYVRTKLQLLGITCLILASKLAEFDTLTPFDGRYVSSDLYTEKEIIEEEKHILATVEMDLIDATPLLFIPKDEQQELAPFICKFASTHKYTAYTSHCVAVACRLVCGKIESPDNPWTSKKNVLSCARSINPDFCWTSNPLYSHSKPLTNKLG